MPEPAAVAAPEATHGAAPGATVASMPNRVLLAEDDRATRESLARALELEGYQVRAVADGSGVLEVIAEEPADVLVLDLMMPHVGGLTVCQRLRARNDRTLRMDEAARRAWRDGRELELTKTEFDLLQLLLRNAGIVLTHSTIYERIWNYDFGPDSKALSVYVGYLRRKTEAAGEPRLLHTVRGVGYTLRPP